MTNDGDDQPGRSTILAAEYTVSDFERWRSLLEQAPPELRHLGARRLVVYRALEDGDRVFSMVGVRKPERVRKLLASPVPLEWFDLAAWKTFPRCFSAAGSSGSIWCRRPRTTSAR